ncbi:exportin-6-like protein [Achlya hypogyna]|uniref:Exportin-6-like protein n=1 Tax=Achlya hypogyna TaxID=1202772 RepID=A0A1V9ZGI5_ACHHY|nr:exportin-6-like protein [Achlya hypogyna]
MERTVDADFDRALDVALGFAREATADDRSRAMSFLSPFKTLSCALQLLQTSFAPHSSLLNLTQLCRVDEKRLWFAVATLEELVRSPVELDLQQLVSFLWTTVLEPPPGCPSYVTSKLRVVLVYVVLRQDALVQFLSQLRETIAAPPVVYHHPALELLAVVCEEICTTHEDSRGFYPTLTKDRVRQRAQFASQLDALAILTVGVLQDIAARLQSPLPHPAAFHDAVAATGARILGHLYTFDLPPSATPAVLQNTIDVLFSLASNRAHVREADRFALDQSSQAACDALATLVTKKWPHQVTDVVVESALGGLLALLGRCDAAAMAAMDEPYLDKVSALTEAFLTTHLRRLEKTAQGLTALLAAVLALTQAQPHVSGLFHCLTVWEIFVSHVEEAEAHGALAPELLRSYETGLVGVMQHLVDRVLYATNGAQLEELDDEPQPEAAPAVAGVDLAGETDALLVVRTGALQDQAQESAEMSDLKAFVFECFSLIRRIAQLPFCAPPLVDKMLPLVQARTADFLQIHAAPLPSGDAKEAQIFAVRDLTVSCALLSCVAAQHYSASNAVSDKMAGWAILRLFLQLAEYIVGHRLHTRGAAFVELECEVLACVRLCTSCVPFVLQSGATADVVGVAEAVLQVVLQTLDTSIVPSPTAVMQAALHLLAAVGTVVPYALHGSISSMATLRATLPRFSLHLPPLIQANLYTAVSNAILQPTAPEADWVAAYDAVVAPVVSSFVESTVAIQQNDARLGSTALLAQVTRDVSICRALAGAIRLKPKAMKLTFATHVMPVMSSALALVRLYLTYLHQNLATPKAPLATAVSATSELVGLYTDVLNAIRKEMPTELIHLIIATFVELFQHAPLTAALESLGAAGTGVLCGFLKLLRILVEESTSTFANLLQSILDLCFGPLHETIFAHKHYDTVVPFFIALMEQILEKHYRFFVVAQMSFDENGRRRKAFANDDARRYFMSILQAVGTIFQQDALPPHLCRQIVQLLERIHKTHQLLDFEAFVEQVRLPYLLTLLKLLIGGHVNLLRDELGALLYRIAAVDFGSFYQVALGQFLQETFPGLDAAQKERVLSSWTGQTDEPTFLQELASFLNDVRVVHNEFKAA